MTVSIATPVTEGVISALEAIANPSGGYIRVGDAAAPPSPKPPPSSFYPYCVVRSTIITSDGSATDPKEDGLHRVEVTSIGKDRAGAQWLSDRAREILLDPELAIDDHAVVWSTDAGGQGTRPDRDVTPPVFFAVAVVNLFVTPLNTGS